MAEIINLKFIIELSNDDYIQYQFHSEVREYRGHVKFHDADLNRQISLAIRAKDITSLRTNGILAIRHYYQE